MHSLDQKCYDWGSARQISVQVSLRSIALSHLVHFPCCIMPAILLLLVLSTTALTPSWISYLLSLHWALLCWGDGKLPKPAEFGAGCHVGKSSTWIFLAFLTCPFCWARSWWMSGWLSRLCGFRQEFSQTLDWFSMLDGIVVSSRVKWNISETLSLLLSRFRRFRRLEAHLIQPDKPLQSSSAIHLLPGTEDAITMRSSM